jgi:hypothetical protein
MNATAKARDWIVSTGASIALVMLALAACSPEHDDRAAAPVSANATVAVVHEEERKCTNEPRTDENGKRPRCEGPGGAKPAVPRAYRFVGGSGDPIDQVVCDIADKFVLDGKLFGMELSGGLDGTYKFVRMPNIPGLRWNASGRYHIDFPDGEDMPGTMATEGGGTTMAGTASRDTTGAEHFTLTPVDACK